MSLFDEIMIGLKEAVEYEKGNSKGVSVRKLSVVEIKNFTPEEIKKIRLDAEMTQGVFAACIGVTKKAVEAWEGGRSKPDGAARRTIGLLQSNPRFADEVGVLVR